MRRQRPNHSISCIERLVHCIAGERSTDRLLSSVAADEQMIENARKAYSNRIAAGWAKEQALAELCRVHRISIEYFDEHLRTIVFALNLVDREVGLYELLEVDSSATKAEIKRAFRRLSLTWHPDVNAGNDAAAERFRLIHHAYNVLGNDKLRQEYDRKLLMPAWAEEVKRKNDEGELPPGRRRRRTQVYQVAVVVVVLIMLSFSVDYQSLLTNRYYKARQRPFEEKEPYSPSASNAHTQESTPEEPKPPPRTDVEQAKTEKPSLPHPVQTVNVNSGEIEPRKSAKPEMAAMLALPDLPLPPPLPVSPPQPTPTTKPQEKKDEHTNQSAAETISPKPSHPQPAPAPSPPKDPPEREHLSQQPVKPPEKVPQRAPAASSDMLPHQVTTQQIRDFLALYTRLYEKKDLPAFLGLFLSNAYENNVPLSNLVNTYLNSFHRTREIRYRIQLRDWSPVEGGIFLSGVFRLSAEFQDRNPVDVTGSIDMKLVHHGNDLRIRYVNYRYDKPEMSR